MTLEDMNYNIAIRQVKRQQYQQMYFIKTRQLDTIQVQIQQLQEALVEAEQRQDMPLVVRIKERLQGLVGKWNKVRKEVK